MAERLYTMKDVVDITGIPATTLRFYDKKGLLQFVRRSVGGVRIFTDRDIALLRLIQFFRNVDMSIQEICRSCASPYPQEPGDFDEPVSTTGSGQATRSVRSEFSIEFSQGRVKFTSPIRAWIVTIGVSARTGYGTPCGFGLSGSVMRSNSTS